MAPSSSSSCATPVVLLLALLQISLLFNNLEAKNGHTAQHHHHNQTRRSNPRLHKAYIALQAWKKVIYSDPKNFTANWIGPSVCHYFGIYCAAVPDDGDLQTVAGIDLRAGHIAGFLPEEIGLLSDLSLLHLNSNRFCGILPQTFSNLTLLYELDLSNNRFVGSFPSVVLSLPMLSFLDLRFNEFEGALPPEVFNKGLDAIFMNNNWFTSLNFPTRGSGKASVMVFANNRFGRCVPPTIASFAHTLEELLLINSSLSGCVPPEVGFLYKLRVLDLSHNNLVGPLPYSLDGLAHLEQLNIAHNMFSGLVPEGVCDLPSLANFTFSYNFFCEEKGACQNLTSKGTVFDDRRNCLPGKPLQRSMKECDAALQHPVECFEYDCIDNGGVGMMPVAAPLALAPAALTDTLNTLPLGSPPSTGAPSSEAPMPESSATLVASRKPAET